jgi:hypothetical protein
MMEGTCTIIIKIPQRNTELLQKNTRKAVLEAMGL